MQTKHAMVGPLSEIKEILRMFAFVCEMLTKNAVGLQMVRLSIEKLCQPKDVLTFCKLKRCAHSQLHI